ncbi:MAG: class I SAM-dependent methyltransferase [bacterium]|nr:class I SAM-dependent methyltransferase [bacterium]
MLNIYWNRNRTNRLEPPPWIQHHYEVERTFAQQIRQTEKNSAARRKLLQEAYAQVTEIQMNYPGGFPAETKEAQYLCSIIESIPTKGRKVLEVGCGTGNLAIALAEKGFEIVGLDLDQQRIQRALAKTNLFTNRVTLYMSDIMTVDSNLVPDNSFDIVVNDNVLEHIVPDEADDFIVRCKSKLKPGGWLVTVTPNRFIGPYDVSRHFLPKGTPAQGLHLKEYSFQELIELISRNEFNKIITLPAAASISVKLGCKKGARIWMYKSKLFETILGYVPAGIRGEKIFRLLVSDIILAQK